MLQKLCHGFSPWVHFTKNIRCIDISFCSYLYSNKAITTTVCACHDSCAVVACANACSDPRAKNRIIIMQTLHRIWIWTRNSLVKWAPYQKCHDIFGMHYRSTKRNFLETNWGYYIYYSCLKYEYNISEVVWHAIIYIRHHNITSRRI